MYVCARVAGNGNVMGMEEGREDEKGGKYLFILHTAKENINTGNIDRLGFTAPCWILNKGVYQHHLFVFELLPTHVVSARNGSLYKETHLRLEDPVEHFLVYLEHCLS